MENQTESQENQEHQKSLGFYPIPENTILTIETGEDNYVDINELISVAMHLSINRPGQKVRYWFQFPENTIFTIETSEEKLRKC